MRCHHSVLTMTMPAIDPTNELGATLAAYELTLNALVTTSDQCRQLSDELLIGMANLVELLQAIRQREHELRRQETLPPMAH